jgi:hypothetical protein
VLAVSNNGWTTNELGLDWVKHFNRHTQSILKGVYRLLILDGHESHVTPEFDQFCKDNKIITLCMPLARQGVYHVDKLEFLWIYQKVRPTALSESNIRSGFRATGLIPYCPERVLDHLTVVRTPSPLGTTAASEEPWIAETPRTTDQLQQQARLVKDLLRRQSQSPTSQAIRQLVKGCQLAMQSATILAQENQKLRASNQRQKRKRQQRRQYIACGGALQVQEGQALVAEAERGVEQGDQGDPGPVQRRAPPTCSKCHVQGHKRTQCRSI